MLDFKHSLLFLLSTTYGQLVDDFLLVDFEEEHRGDFFKYRNGYS